MLQSQYVYTKASIDYRIRHQCNLAATSAVTQQRAQAQQQCTNSLVLAESPCIYGLHLCHA
jgi:hypothetical protein